MGKFSLSRLMMCAKYQRLTSEDYIRLGLCDPQSCPDCSDGHGHYVKNDKVAGRNLLLNNQLEDKLGPQSAPLKTIVNNLHQDSITCNKCKELNTRHCAPPSRTSVKGVVNLAFVEQGLEDCSWFQPCLLRELAVKILADCPVGSFVVRNSQTQAAAGCLAMTVRVPKSFNGTGILHYLVLVSEAGFRIKGFTKVFPTLSGLVVHHSVMKEHLPCRLLIEEESSSGESDRDSDFADLDSDPGYPCIISSLREQLSQ